MKHDLLVSRRGSCERDRRWCAPRSTNSAAPPQSRGRGGGAEAPTPAQREGNTTRAAVTGFVPLRAPGFHETPGLTPSPPRAGSPQEQSGWRAPSPAPPCPQFSRHHSDCHRLQARLAEGLSSFTLGPPPPTTSGFRRKAAPADWPRSAGGGMPRMPRPNRQLLKEYAKQRP